MTMTEAKSLFFYPTLSLPLMVEFMHACLAWSLWCYRYSCFCISISVSVNLFQMSSACSLSAVCVVALHHCEYWLCWPPHLLSLLSLFFLVLFFCVDSEGACKKPRINQHNCNANNTTGPWHLWASMDPSCLSFHPSLHASFWPSFLPSFFLTPAAALICVAFCCVCCSHQCKDRECFFSTNTFFSMEQFTQSRGDTIRETYINT